MAKLVLFNMMSVDGFFEGPSMEIDWHNVDDEFQELAVEQLNKASALIFGRKTYELMAAYWPTPEAHEADPVVSCLMNHIPKYVFSKTTYYTEWTNTNMISQDAVEVCHDLKHNLRKDIFIFGSAELASSLLDAGLIDEIRVTINPVLLGSGNSLFKARSTRLKLSLERTMVFGSGNVMCVYKPVY